MSALRRMATQLLEAASWLLPRRLSYWSDAMRGELAETPDDRSALVFACGCVRAAIVLAILARYPSVKAALTFGGIAARPRRLGLVCGAGAVGAGIAHMLLSGAPQSYLYVNLAAFLIGTTGWIALRPVGQSRLAGAGIVVLLLALLLALTAVAGGAVQGASRWLSVGPVMVQISLIALPVIVVIYGRQPDAAGTIGVIVAAIALALQPDPAMAGVLLAALLVLAGATHRPFQIIAAAAAALAFGWSLLTAHTKSAADVAPAPFVDQIYYSAFDVHPLLGLLVISGAFFLVVPAIVGLFAGAGDRRPLLAFGACWTGITAAAALGNYPAPLVGFGGSAVLGYLLSVSFLPAGSLPASHKGDVAAQEARKSRKPPPGELRSMKLV